MQKYRWLLTLGLMAATSGAVMADGFLPSFRAQSPATQSNRGKSYNQQVAERIAGALRTAKLTGSNVEIEFNKGVATLQGRVADAGQQRRAAAVVGRVTGVRRVANNLTVETKQASARSAPVRQTSSRRTAPSQPATPWAPTQKSVQANDPTPPRQAAPSNQKIAESIASALGTVGLNSYDIEIRVQDGLATLGGVVGTADQKRQAQHIANQVAGVNRVNNLLTTDGISPARFQPGSTPPPAPAALQPTPPTAPGAPATPAATANAPYTAPPVPHMAPVAPVMPAAPAAPSPYAQAQPGVQQASYDQPNMPGYAWPSYAQYPNYAAVTYPQEYSPSAWPYIGPFYPYPQVPLGWRKAQLEWDDGYWNLNFSPRTEKWFWFMNPRNWHD